MNNDEIRRFLVERGYSIRDDEIVMPFYSSSINKLEKAIKPEYKDKWIIGGIAGTSNPKDDIAGEEVPYYDPSAIDLSYAKENGKYTWRHPTINSLPKTCAIGEIIEIYCQNSVLMAYGELDQGGNEYAKDVWEIVNNSKLKKPLGQSVDGLKIINPANPKKIIKAFIRNIAIDHNPVNLGNTLEAVALIKSLGLDGLLPGLNELPNLMQRMDMLEKSLINNSLKCNHLDQNGKFKTSIAGWEPTAFDHLIKCKNKSHYEAIKFLNEFHNRRN